RKSAKSHGISTDSSFRFERGTDPEMTITALKRAAALLTEICGARVNGNIIDHYPAPLEPFAVDLKRSNIKKIVGIDIPSDTIKQILKGLGISILSENESGFLLSVPRFKSDVSREIDVIEELIRIYGFKHIPLERSMKMSLRYEKDSPLRQAELRISELLRANGFREIMTNSLSSDKYYEEKSQLVYLSNPLSAEMNVLRQSMLYSALESVAYNKNRKQSNTRFFEFGKVYFLKEKGFKETEQLLILASGTQSNESWETSAKNADQYYLRSLVNKVYDLFHVQADKAEIKEVESKTLQLFGIKDPVFYVALEWTKAAKAQVKFKLQAIPQFPSVRRDLSLVLDKQVKFEKVEDIIRKQNSKLISGVNVFDVYEGKPLEAGKKAVSISIDLYDENKTLSDQDIEPLMEKLILQFETELQAIIRK
ncbi:MAG: phenylalanine--tRNA ligase subunit beta, partial [Chitinophagaceae bacterium]